MSLVGDLLYTSPEIASKYRVSKYWTPKELKSDLARHSQEQYSKEDAPIRISESMALVQQTPWILNKSIKDNILFGSEYDEARYNETIKICQLRRDLEILPGGD